MGLDMYLYAEEYVSGYDFTASLKPLGTEAEPGSLSDVSQVVSEPAPLDAVACYRALLHLVGLADIADPDTPSATVSVTAAYWRKVNAVHAWFVENVQEGRDECQRSYVRLEQLRELRDLAASVVERSRSGEDEDAWEDLPPTNGLFFGSTDTDQWYLESLDDTVRQLDRVLNHPKATELSFYYQASW